MSPNHAAIAASYEAVVAKACVASMCRVSCDSVPWTRSSSSTSSYCSGRHTGITWTKFLAAARSIDGPPTSIISIASASVTPRRPATDAKG